MRMGFEHAGLDFWLSSIACHAPDAPVLIVGTQLDQVRYNGYWYFAERNGTKRTQLRGPKRGNIFFLNAIISI